MKAIIKNNQIILEPREWNSSYFSSILFKNGVNISLSVTEPDSVLTYGDIKIVPSSVSIPEINGDNEVVEGSYPEIVGESVVVIYSKRNKTEEELNPPKSKKELAIESYTSFVNSLGLDKKSTSSEIFAKLVEMKSGNITVPYMGVNLNYSDVGQLIQGLMHDVEVNGGSWNEL